MNDRNRNWLSITILLLTIVGIGAYFRANPNSLDPIRQISISHLLILVLLRFAFLLLNGVILNLFVMRFDVKLAWREWVGLALVTTLGNYITPFSGGMLARATYLKVKYQLAYANFIALLGASYLITFTVASLIGIFSLVILNQWQTQTYLLAGFLILVFLGVLVVMVFPINWVPKNGNRLIQTVTAVLEGWQQLRTDRELLWQLGLVTIVSMLLNGIAFWVAYQALGFNKVQFPEALLVSLSAVYSTILTITPGNVGIREAIVSLTSELINIGIGEGLLVALLIRLGTLVSVFSLGPIFSIWLTRQLE